MEEAQGESPGSTWLAHLAHDLRRKGVLNEPTGNCQRMTETHAGMQARSAKHSVEAEAVKSSRGQF